MDAQGADVAGIDLDVLGPLAEASGDQLVSGAACARDWLSLLRLDVLGLVALALVLAFAATCGCCCLFLCNGCGRRRWWQQLARIFSRAEPFVDLLGERVGSRALTALGFTFGFALASGALLSRSMLLSPTLLFPPRSLEPVAELRHLCAEPLWDALLRAAAHSSAAAERKKAARRVKARKEASAREQQRLQLGQQRQRLEQQRLRREAGDGPAGSFANATLPTAGPRRIRAQR
jgi:hypothetical protein